MIPRNPNFKTLVNNTKLHVLGAISFLTHQFFKDSVGQEENLIWAFRSVRFNLQFSHRSGQRERSANRSILELTRGSEGPFVIEIGDGL